MFRRALNTLLRVDVSFWNRGRFVLAIILHRRQKTANFVSLPLRARKALSFWPEKER